MTRQFWVVVCGWTAHVEVRTLFNDFEVQMFHVEEVISGTLIP